MSALTVHLGTDITTFRWATTGAAEPVGQSARRMIKMSGVGLA